MKNFNLFFFFLIFSLGCNTNSFSQSLSAGGQNAVTKLQNEHFPRLKKMKTNLEENRSTVSTKDCDNYIDNVNKAVGVWNTVPRSDYSNPKIKPVKTELDSYIAFAKEAQVIFKERQAAEESNTVQKNPAPNNTKTEVVTNFKVGDKVSLVSNSEWTWGVVTGIAGKDFQPKAGIAYQDLEVDVKIKAYYLSVGKEIVGLKDVFEYWPYHEFFAELKKLDINQFPRMMFEVLGRNFGPGVFTPNGPNMEKLNTEIKAIENLLSKYPPIPEDLKKYEKWASYRNYALAYKLALDKKEEFFKKQMEKRIDEHVNLLYKGNFSPISIRTNEQLTYLDGKKNTIFWTDIICENPDRIKKAVLKDINDFLIGMGNAANAESYLKDWDNMIAQKKAKYSAEADKVVNWATNYPFSDASALALFKRDIGGSPTKISFESSAYVVSGGIQNKDKRKYGIAFFPKDPGCDYHFYIKFTIWQTHKGNGVYDAPKCLYSSSGYTKKM